METNTIQKIPAEQEQQLYIPPNCKPLSDETQQQQIRLGLQGQFGEGKTWAATTFPNPIVINLNRGLGAHAGRNDIYEVKMYDPAFVDSMVKRTAGNPPNKRDAITKWLRDEGYKLTKNQTLIVDSLSDLERAFDMQEALEPVITDRGKVDTLAFWRHKIEWFAEVVDILMSLRCNVVLCSHEQLDRNKDGELNGKLKPLVTGQTADKLGKDFTDWFRQRASDKPKEGEKVKPETLKMFGMNEPEWNEWIKSFPRNTIYYWQTESDNIFSGKCSSMVNFPRFVPANYTSFLKYRRVISPAS